jgi:hypothetical protein
MNDFVEFAGQNWLLFLALFAVIGMLLGGGDSTENPWC